MKWTSEEKELLKSKGYDPFGDSIASYKFSSHAGFDSYFLTKNEDGTIRYSASYPINVDVDDGSYDLKQVEENYKNLNEYFKC